MSSSTFDLKPGTSIECVSLSIQLIKETIFIDGIQELFTGFSIGGGIDQDFRQSPQNFTDNGIYITNIVENSPAEKCGLKIGDKLLSVNGYDFTTVTHKKAVEKIRKHNILNFLIARKGLSD